jgi:phospholipase/carboxylesterase
MAADTDELLDATTALIPPLLGALQALARAGRRLHPPDLAALAAGLAPLREPLAHGLQVFEAAGWPQHLGVFESHSRRAATAALEALDGFAACLERSQPVLGAYRALGAHSRALEALYPVAFMLPPVNRFFLSDDRRCDQTLQQRLLEADPARADAGVMHGANAPDERGGFSLYVPEYYDPEGPALPLVVALHGGSGHDRRFLWSWLIDARSRGAIVIAPTARGDTWSLMAPDGDAENLLGMVAHVRSRWRVDERRLLLTGISDGGTFCYLAGLRADSPFTHLAPISATFHPLLLEGAGAGRLAGLPVYLVHGALDWMFPVEVARMARDALGAAGARLTYRELEDTSHTYPQEENVRILDWLTEQGP